MPMPEDGGLRRDPGIQRTIGGSPQVVRGEGQAWASTRVLDLDSWP